MRITNHNLQNARAFVTGASGFIGRHLLAALTSRGAAISALQHEQDAGTEREKTHVGDLSDAIFVKRALATSAPDFIFHLAAFKERSARIADFNRALETNLIGSLNLFSAAATLPSLKAIIVLGTAEEYGPNNSPFIETMREHPVSAYSYSKQCMTNLCEILHHLHGLPIVVLRPTIAYGPGQSTDMFLPALIRSLLSNRPFPMTAGRQTRDFVYVSDVVNAILIAATQPGAAGHILNVGSGRPITIENLARKVAAITGNAGLLQLGKLPYRQGEVMDYSVDLAKTCSILGWSPQIDFTQGLAATIDHFRKCD